MSEPEQSDAPTVTPGKDTAAPAPAEAEVEQADLGEVEEVDLAVVEAILFATDSPLSAAKIVDVAGLTAGRRAVHQAVEILNERYERMGCAFRIEPLAGGYQMLTLPEYNDVLARLLKVRSESRLSQAAMETLAIIAYKQPILRADIEAIRGVASGEIVRGLLEKGLAKIVGRAEEIGRPMLYGTTRKFLEVFGLTGLKDLPKVAELAIGATAEKPAEKPAEKSPAEPDELTGAAEQAEPAEPDEPTGAAEPG